MLDKLKDQMFPWQPIEERPTNGKRILVSDGDQWCVGYDNGDMLHYDMNETAAEFLSIDTPVMLAAALRIAVDAMNKTLSDNGHLADGEVCTLIDLKNALKQIEEALNGTARN